MNGGRGLVVVGQVVTVVSVLCPDEAGVTVFQHVREVVRPPDDDAVRGSLMVYCDRQEDGSWGDLQALDKLIGAYDDPDAGEDALGPVASIEQLVDGPDHAGVLEGLVAFLEVGLSPSQALDYWATEDTDETHGAFTQKEWAEVRGVSRQAVGANAGNARDTLGS